MYVKRGRKTCSVHGKTDESSTFREQGSRVMTILGAHSPGHGASTLAPPPPEASQAEARGAAMSVCLDMFYFGVKVRDSLS